VSNPAPFLARAGSEITVRTSLRPNATDYKQMPASLNGSLAEQNSLIHDDSVSMKQDMSVKRPTALTDLQGISAFFD